MNQKTEIVLSLISHTNIGKTSLARTILRRDIGEIRDEPHVTDESTRHILLESGDAALVLWDTPGFGHVGELIKRLEREENVWGWLMNEVVDRFFNRPLYCSLEAVRNIRNHSDVVLYLVNVQENPGDAGYVQMEFRLLEALAKPVVLVLNQVHVDQLVNRERMQRLKAEWRKNLEAFSCLREVVVLDAFMRSWHHEIHLMDVVQPLLAEPKRTAMLHLRQNYIHQQEKILDRCSEAACRVFWFARSQTHSPVQGTDAKDVFLRLAADLQNRLDAYVDLLMEQHGIESDGRAELLADIEQANGIAVKTLDEKKTGLFTGALTAAGTGLMADIMSGGLTFGGGAVLGFLGGCLGGFSFSRLFNMRQSGPVSWKAEALVELFKMMIFYYLLAAHHGRGKGNLPLDDPALYLSSKLNLRSGELEIAIRKLADHAGPEAGPPEAGDMHESVDLFKNTVHATFATIYRDGAE